jgi:hypothetical protein
MEENSPFADDFFVAIFTEDFWRPTEERKEG